MNHEILKTLGLTDAEINVYLALFNLGDSLASKIAKKAHVERSFTYHALESLIQKGLVGYVIKENRKYFHAVEPEKLLDFFKEKKEKMQEQEDTLSKLIRSLHLTKATKTPFLNVEVYRGVEGFKTVMNDLIKEKKNYFIIGYTAKSTTIAKYWYAHWNYKRVKMKIKRFLLIPKSMEKKTALKFPLTEVRHLPKKYTAPAKASTIIYGTDKTLIFLPLLDDFAGIAIKNKEIHNSYKDFFDLMWKEAK